MVMVHTAHRKDSVSRLVAIWNWLQEGGPKDLKHSSDGGWSHPIAICLLHYAIVTTVSFLAHDVSLALYLYPSKKDCAHDELSLMLQPRRQAVALWFIFYVAFLLLWRLGVAMRNNDNESSIPSGAAVAAVLYEYCWLCNVTLFISAWALLCNRPILAEAYAVTVGIDQLLWYVDATGYLLTGKFVVGVAQYLCWPGNSNWSSRITCTHHFWTIPLIFYACGCLGYNGGTKANGALGATTGGLHVLACPLSFVYMTINVILSRCWTPSNIETIQTTKTVAGTIPKTSHSSPSAPSASKYLNVNLSHALWKDIKFEFLQINYDHPPALVYLFRLLWRWQAFNTIIFVFLFCACRLLLLMFNRNESSVAMVC